MIAFTALVDAMNAIEAEFEPLKGQLPKEYDKFEDKLLEDILRTFDSAELRSASGDLFGRIYEYFLMKFAMQGAQDNGEFFTPPSLVQTIVQSGRRRDYSRRPPTPPCERFRTRRFLSACSVVVCHPWYPISTLPCLTDSVRYLRVRPSCEASAQNSQNIRHRYSDRFGPSSTGHADYYGFC